MKNNFVPTHDFLLSLPVDQRELTAKYYELPCPYTKEERKKAHVEEFIPPPICGNAANTGFTIPIHN